MFLRNWVVIALLAAIGLVLAMYWLSLPKVPDGVTPQGATDEAVKAIAALAGSITTLGGAVFGVLGKLNEYRKTTLEIEEKKIALEEKKQKRKDA